MVSSILYTIVGAIIGGLVTFYFTRKKFEKEIKENPPINEKMIDEQEFNIKIEKNNVNKFYNILIIFTILAIYGEILQKI